MSLASTPSTEPDPKSRFSDFNGTRDDDDDMSGMSQPGIRDAVSWSRLNLSQSTVSLPEYIQNSSPASPELPDNEQVCYGMIYQVEVKLSENNMPKLNSELHHEAQVTAAERVLTFTVERKVDHLTIAFSDGVTLGILSDLMFESFGLIMERNSSFFLEGVAPINLLRERIGKISKSSDRKIRIDINVYGPRGTKKKIGDELSGKKVWLQRPDNYKTNVPYDNPHVVSFPEINHVSADANNARRALDGEGQLAKQDRIQKMVSEVYVSLQRAGELETTSGDRRLQTRLLEYVHRVTKTRSTVKPEERGGGVLADDMGMGKSLCLLALLLETLDEGRQWAQQKHSEEYHGSAIERYSRATLVVVPSASYATIVLINNWLNEVKTHLGDTLKWIKYHGVGREKDLDALADSDLIVTTYQTLRQEFANKRSMLHKIEWYRVVLDEAHVIRRPSNTFHSTCLELEARSRWCLTGTPIQNRLLDIGALFAFLRAEPFHNIAQFRRFIVLPFEQGDEGVKDRLVLLYDSLCLRRNKDILCLPGTDERERPLRFSPEEMKQYQSTLKTLQRSVSEKVGQYEKHREFGLFQAQLQLRILCNHGTYQKPFSWKRNMLQLDESLAIESGTGFEARCDGCEQPRPALVLTTNSLEDVKDRMEEMKSIFVLDAYDGPVTTGTGAFGLNITAASRVFILEPQWNPSVENQAIARTTRLNQKEKVVVVRYRIEETVETEMLSQQKQKREIARIGW
ncbi:hypothetical protein EKO27_g2635 [Xylaria grammica]|uniref:Helicase ATP-binding domain-containing protein n=1 Tax=Xylaria grammica TaxID=363999 RepID=A0A439DDG6_9PEZI|nr:hypothetical protein EKO27_g2635 [Xylaria grammica]